MRIAFRYFLNGAMIVLFLLQSGCGFIELWWYAPNTKKEDWNDWQSCRLSAEDIHPVYCLENAPNSKDASSKPPLLLLHELNGLTPQTFRYAMELSKDFTVYIPMLFGKKGEESLWDGQKAYWFGDEWSIPSKGSAPIVKWLRNVVSDIERKHESTTIRIIGNCMTGALPLALLSKADGTLNTNVDVVVLSQPALPMRFWWRRTDEDSSSLDISNDDLLAAQQSKAKILALRLKTDWVSPSEKQQTLCEFSKNFKGRLTAVEIRARGYDPENKKLRPHSTLIGEYDAVQEEVRKQSKYARETVRKFLLDPTNTNAGNGQCPSKVSAGSGFESERVRS